MEIIILYNNQAWHRIQLQPFRYATIFQNWNYYYYSQGSQRAKQSSFSHLIQSYLQRGSTWWSLDQEYNAYPTELTWYVLFRGSLNWPFSCTTSLFSLRINRGWLHKDLKSDLQAHARLDSRSSDHQAEPHWRWLFSCKTFDANIAIFGNRKFRM